MGHPLRKQMTLPSGLVITLNSDQSLGLQKMMNWWDMKNLTTFTLRGYAGTGKTTICKEFIDWVNWGIVVTAPTHKAKAVIAKSTRRPAITVQSLLGLQPNVDLENFDINRPQFNRRGEPKIRDAKLVVVDEGSMFNRDLFDLITREASKWEVKILFMGDPAQLPPVNEDLSLIFSKVDEMSLLSIVERQADGNPLMLVYDAIRSDIESTYDRFDHVTSINDKGEGITFLKDNNDFFEAICQDFELADKYNPDAVKAMAWTNKRVRAINKHIRTELYGKDVGYLEKGEYLMSYSNVGYGDNIVIENSADYRIEDFAEWNETIRYPDKDEVDIIDMWKVRLMPADPQMGYMKEVNVVVPNVDNYKRFLSSHSWYLDRAKSANPGTRSRSIEWGKYYGFKDKHLLLHDIRKKNNDGELELQVTKDFDHAYAITVHKSQGSTYGKVFIDENDINHNKKHRERNNLKYVALSRPQKTATVLSSLTGHSFDKPNKVVVPEIKQPKGRALSISPLRKRKEDIEEEDYQEMVEEMKTIAKNFGFKLDLDVKQVPKL